MSIFAPLQHKCSSATSAPAPSVSRLSHRVPVPETLQFPPVEASSGGQAGGKPVPHFSLADLPIHAPGQRSASLPDPLRAAMERLSGLPLDDVRVHYHSLRPLQVGASAYTQGTQIHLGPGQERYLPHESWHVVQQKQGRVAPTLRIGGGEVVNDEKALEQEADVMGKQARQGTGKPFSGALRYAPLAALPRSAGIQPIQRKIIIADDLRLALKEQIGEIMNHPLYIELEKAPQLIYIQRSKDKNDTSVRTDLNKDTFEDKLPGGLKNKGVRYLINLQDTNVKEGKLSVDAENRLKAFEPQQEEKREELPLSEEELSLARLIEETYYSSLLTTAPKQPVPHQPVPQQPAPSPSINIINSSALTRAESADPYENFSPRSRELLTKADDLLYLSRRSTFPRVPRIDPELLHIPTEDISPTSNVPPTGNINPTGNVLPTGNVPLTSIVPPSGNIPPVNVPPISNVNPNVNLPAQAPSAQKHESLSLYTVLLHEMGHVRQHIRSQSPFSQGKDREDIDEESLPRIPDDLLPQTVQALENLNPEAKIWHQLTDLNGVVQVWLTTLEDFFGRKSRDDLMSDVKQTQEIGKLVAARAQVWLEYDVITNVEHPEALKRGEAVRHIHGVEGTVDDPDHKNFDQAIKTIKAVREKTLQSDPRSLPDVQQVMLKNAYMLTENLPSLLKRFLAMINDLKGAVEKLKK